MDVVRFVKAEYARSNRSTCRDCERKIRKHELRIASVIDHQGRSIEQWYHVPCFFTRRAGELYHMGALTRPDQIRTESLDAASKRAIERYFV